MKYKLSLFLMTLISTLFCWLLPINSWAMTNAEELSVLATGSCGQSLTYTVYSDLSLVISGTGEMSDYMGEVPHIDASYYQKIESVVIEDGVTSIGDFAFYDFIHLTSLSIANSVTKIGNAAFYECTSLTSLDIPNSVIEIGNGAFYGCYDLTSIVIPNGVKVISPVLFFNCTGLTSVTIPDGVTEIGNAAFECCSSLTSVVIPSSVTSIGDAAFELCSSLTSITVENATPVAISSSTFNSVDKTACTLYVPAGTKSAYESAEVWNEFEKIVESGEPNTDISALDNAIYVEQVEGRIGSTMDIPVMLKNSYGVCGFQFVMELPEGTTINSWALSTKRLPEGATLNDKISTQKIDGNKISVACSLNYGGETFTGNDGEIATVNVTFGEDMEVGIYPIYFTDCDVTSAGGTDEDLSDIKASLVLEDYVLGDANGDGKVRIGDATTILNYIVGTVAEGFNEKAADANSDGKIRIGDATSVLNIIVNQ